MNNHKPLTQRIIDGLNKAIVELEEFQLQVALGKAEAHDLYNESKKKFGDYIHSVKNSMGKSASKVQDESAEIKSLLGQIQEHLSDIKTETEEAFEEQKKSLLHLLFELETYIRSHKALNSLYSDLLTEIEIFRLKLEILKYRMDRKKAAAKEEFEKQKDLFRKKIANLMRLHGEDQERWEHFQKEMSEAYKHLKNAFAAPHQ